VIVKSLPAGIVLHYTIQPLSKSGIEAGRDRGATSWDWRVFRSVVSGCGSRLFPDSRGKLTQYTTIGWVFTCEWPNEGSDDAAAQKAVNTMAETVQYLAKERGLLLDLLCMSFAAGSQKPLRSYGADNLKRVQDTVAKYDPEGVFQKLQYGGFLLRDNI
jgi:hypothetical protein